MLRNQFTRRDWLVGAGSSLAALAVPLAKASATPGQTQSPVQQDSAEVLADRARRMKWWHDARFGMFIHFGLYSVMGRAEWVLEEEGIPIPE